MYRERQYGQVFYGRFNDFIKMWQELNAIALEAEVVSLRLTCLWRAHVSRETVRAGFLRPFQRLHQDVAGAQCHRSRDGGREPPPHLFMEGACIARDSTGRFATAVSTTSSRCGRSSMPSLERR